jgi:hypothetical protein
MNEESSAKASRTSTASKEAVDDFDRLAAIMTAHLHELAKPHVLAARPGYVLGGDGYPLHTPAIVLTLARGVERASVSLPASLDGVPIDVRVATEAQELQIRHPNRFAARSRNTRDEYVPAHPRQQVTLAHVPAADQLADDAGRDIPQIPYTAPAAPVTLDPVTAKMTITCSVSPDNGWDTLSAFLAATQSDLTVAMYDFTSRHIEAAVAQDLARKRFSLVLDHPPKDPSADQTDEQTIALLDAALPSKFQSVWALSHTDPLIDAWIFQSAYHIKVAVQDDARFWLSSGNWNNSNQPIFDYAAPDETLAENSDRDWHVVVEHPGLAQTFKAFIANDFRVAAKHQAGDAATERDVLPGLAPNDAVASAAFKKFFAASTFTERVTVTPLLTPDGGIYAPRILALIDSARTNFWMQTQYVTAFSNDPGFAALIDALASAQKRGVELRLIMSQYQQETILEEMQNAGIAVNHSHVRIQNRVHNKGMLVDGHLTVVSSQNWSAAGVLRNRDAGLIIDSTAIYSYFAAVFQHDWHNLATAKPSP